MAKSKTFCATKWTAGRDVQWGKSTTYHFQEVLDEHAGTLLGLALCQDVGEPFADSATHKRDM